MGRSSTATLTTTPVDEHPHGQPSAAAPRAPARKKNRSWYRLISPVAVIALWQVASSTGLISTQKLPSPVTVWRTAVGLITQDSPAYGTLQGAMLVSLERMAIGFAFGAAAAVIFALIAGLSRFGENAVDPVLQILRTLPLFGLLPLFIVWFGIDNLPKIILIALGTAIPLYLNMFAGIRSVDGKLIEAARTLKLTKLELIRDVILPGALPQTPVSVGGAWSAPASAR